MVRKNIVWAALLAAGMTLAGNYLLYAEDTSDGVHDTYYKSGEKQYESTYKDGQLEGITTEYEKDGTVKDKFKFKNGDLVSKQGVEPTRDMGRLSFLTKWW